MIGLNTQSPKRFEQSWHSAGPSGKTLGRLEMWSVSPASSIRCLTLRPSENAKGSSGSKKSLTKFYNRRLLMENLSGLKPLGRAVLVRMYSPEKKGSVIEIPDSAKKSDAVMEQRALVIEVGESCWIDEPVKRCEAGDKVIVTKMAGYLTKGPADGKLYRLVNDRDIFCKITEEAEVANV